MSDDLNIRAARAMGWQKVFIHEVGGVVGWKNGWGGLAPRYTTDANACRELLQEVEKLGQDAQNDFVEKLHGAFEASGNKDKYYSIWLVTAPLPALVEAACEVLEATK